MHTLSRTSGDTGWTRHGIVARSTLGDAAELAGRLRPEDVRELADAAGKDPLTALRGFVLYGEPCLTLRGPDGVLVGMVTAVPAGPAVASIGMVGTPEITRRSLPFLRGSREVFSRLHRLYDGLVCAADARNAVHLHWLEWLGFVPLRRVEGFGPGRIEAVEFASIRTPPHV